MELMERIKAECEERKFCGACKLYDLDNQGCPFASNPCNWNIKAIRMALGETSDKASEIVVPNDFDMRTMPTKPVIVSKVKEIICCLEQIAERINK